MFVDLSSGSSPDAVLHQRGHPQTGAHPARRLRQPPAHPGQDQDPPRAAGRPVNDILLCFEAAATKL